MDNIPFSDINWKATIWLNLLRVVCATVVWVIILLLMGLSSKASSMLILPLLYFAFLLPLGLVAGYLARAGVPYAGFFSLMSAIAIVVGDPLVFLLKQIWPAVVPSRYFNPINWNLVLFVLY